MSQEICGECNNQYSKACGEEVFCQVHKTYCFRCRPCDEEQEEELLQCQRCQRRSAEQDMFYDYRCEGYLCRDQFEDLAAEKQVVKLPCGCIQLREHVLAFMTHYCEKCTRRLENPDRNKRKFCKICKQRKGYFTGETSEESSPSEWRKSQQLQWDDYSQLNDFPLPLKTEEDFIVQQLREKIRTVQEKYYVSEYTRMEFKKALLNEGEDQCPLCILPFSLTRTPLMVCLQQHLLCQPCFEAAQGLTKCPLCRDPIQIGKVSVYQPRMATLELQQYIAEKVDSKQRRFEEYTKDLFNPPLTYKVIEAEIQTNLSVPIPPPQNKKTQDTPVKPKNYCKKPSKA